MREYPRKPARHRSILGEVAVRTIALLTLGLVVAMTLALLSSNIHRVGPEQVVYSNLCGPTTSDLCYKPVLKGGYPFAYLFDAPGISREDQLAFIEDHFHAWPFAFDVALYFAALLVLWWITSRSIQRHRTSH
jgi:hypothetical protein